MMSIVTPHSPESITSWMSWVRCCAAWFESCAHDDVDAGFGLAGFLEQAADLLGLERARTRARPRRRRPGCRAGVSTLIGSRLTKTSGMPAPAAASDIACVAEVSTGLTMIASTPEATKLLIWSSCLATSFCASSIWTSTPSRVPAYFSMPLRSTVRKLSSKSAIETPTFAAEAVPAMETKRAAEARRCFMHSSAGRSGSAILVAFVREHARCRRTADGGGLVGPLFVSPGRVVLGRPADGNAPDRAAGQSARCREA